MFRPESFDEFIGQEQVVNQLKIIVQAAIKRGEAVPHILLAGPPGLGKTTLANIVANSIGVKIKVTTGPVLERSGDIAAILAGLSQKDIVFIDEIHRLPRHVEEVLYPAMEDFKLDLIVGKGPAARSVRLNLPFFTLIGATTRPGLLTAPLRDRFRRILTLDYYLLEDMVKIAYKVVGKVGLNLEENAAVALAKRARGTPRQLINLILTVRDFVQIRDSDTITLSDVEEALKTAGIDEEGLTRIDLKILEVLALKFDGGPVGLATLAAAIGEEAETIEEVYEPFLIRKGFLQKTSRGRKLTKLGWKKVTGKEDLTLFK